MSRYTSKIQATFHLLIRLITQLLAEALIRSKNQTLLINREPTASEAMAMATPILALRLIDILIDNERVISPSSLSNASYSPLVLVGDLKKSVSPFHLE